MPSAGRHHAGRPVVALLQAAGDDADDAGMPALAAREHERALRRPLSFDLGDGGVEHGLLDRAPLGVEGVEPARQGGGLGRVVGRQQADAEIGRADAAAGIDARPEHEAGVIGAGRLLEPGHVRQGGQPEIAAPRHHLQALADERAIERR